MKIKPIYGCFGIMCAANVGLVIGLVNESRSTVPLRSEIQELKKALGECNRDLKMQKMINGVPPRQETPEPP